MVSDAEIKTPNEGDLQLIRWIVDRRHVADEPDEVADDIEQRLRRAAHTSGITLHPDTVNNWREAAKNRHSENLTNYYKIARGDFT